MVARGPVGARRLRLRQLLDLVAGEQRGAAISGDGASEASAADVGVEGGLRDVEDRRSFARADQRAHAPSVIAGIDGNQH